VHTNHVQNGSSCRTNTSLGPRKGRTIGSAQANRGDCQNAGTALLITSLDKRYAAFTPSILDIAHSSQLQNIVWGHDSLNAAVAHGKVSAVTKMQSIHRGRTCRNKLKCQRMEKGQPLSRALLRQGLGVMALHPFTLRYTLTDLTLPVRECIVSGMHLSITCTGKAHQ
jgi:hypothetical protein